MSTLFANVFGNRIVVATDTLADLRCVDGNKKAHVAKMIPVPHLPAVLAARGEVRYTCSLAGAALMAGTFDDLLDSWDALVAQLSNALPEQVADYGMEVVLAGWSPRRRRLFAMFAVKPRGGQFEMSEMPHDLYAPPPYTDGTMPPTPQTPQDRVALARRQAERIRTESDGVAGGDLTIATLTRDGVNVEVVRGFMGEAAGAAETSEAAFSGGPDTGAAERAV